MDSITDRLGITYTVTRAPLGANAVAYYAFAGGFPVARAVLRLDKGWISDVVVLPQGGPPAWDCDGFVRPDRGRPRPTAAPEPDAIKGGAGVLGEPRGPTEQPLNIQRCRRSQD